MSFDMLIDTTGNVYGGVAYLSAEVREMTPFRGGDGKPVPQAPEECWLLFSYQTSLYSPAGAHFWIYRLPVRPNIQPQREGWQTLCAWQMLMNRGGSCYLYTQGFLITLQLLAECTITL